MRIEAPKLHLKAMPEYAIWFTTWVVIFTFIGHETTSQGAQL